MQTEERAAQDQAPPRRSAGEAKKMSQILVCATPVPGHVNPMIAVARQLCERGNRVLFQSAEVFRKQAESAGLRFVRREGQPSFAFRQMNELFPERQKTPAGLPQLIYDLKHFFGDQIPAQAA